jgi:hypothetical protein
LAVISPGGGIGVFRSSRIGASVTAGVAVVIYVGEVGEVRLLEVSGELVTPKLVLEGCGVMVLGVAAIGLAVGKVGAVLGCVANKAVALFVAAAALSLSIVEKSLNDFGSVNFGVLLCSLFDGVILAFG